MSPLGVLFTFSPQIPHCVIYNFFLPPPSLPPALSFPPHPVNQLSTSSLSCVSSGLQLQHLISISISGQLGDLEQDGLCCPSVRVCVREKYHPQYFLFIFHNFKYFFPLICPSVNFLSSLVLACLGNTVYAIISLSIFLSSTTILERERERERAQLMLLSPILAQRCCPLQISPFFTILHHIQYNYYLFKSLKSSVKDLSQYTV